jgi:putative endonuclease
LSRLYRRDELAPPCIWRGEVRAIYNMAVFIYLIYSLKDESFYTGITTDPHRRLKEHNKGNLPCTASKRPWKLVYTKEHASYEEARKHEKWLKKKNKQYKQHIMRL